MLLRRVAILACCYSGALLQRRIAHCCSGALRVARCWSGALLQRRVAAAARCCSGALLQQRVATVACCYSGVLLQRRVAAAAHSSLLQRRVARSSSGALQEKRVARATRRKSRALQEPRVARAARLRVPHSTYRVQRRRDCKCVRLISVLGLDACGPAFVQQNNASPPLHLLLQTRSRNSRR